jgi:hypothetical protein
MDMARYVAITRQRISDLEINKATIIERGIRMRSRWGRTPFVDTTNMCLAELDRRIRELTTIANAIERGQAI